MNEIAAVGAAYDEIAELYDELVRQPLYGKPFDDAMLAIFTELVGPGGVVADIGCGQGRLTAQLAESGLDVRGIDVSRRLLALARNEFPQLRFDEGSMEDLDFGAASLDGLVAWYSFIHLPPERIPGVLNGFHRVLRAGGHALFAFQATDGSEVVEPFDHKVIRAYRWSPERLAELLRDSGFEVSARMVREPGHGERFEQAYVLCCKPR
ncbi:class I SAM-dependent DNA methyltransferase [Nocardia goodfellowii]|uniref:Ubiquinone/menaquinone biosynthesis C-methylase UbiE n=1 Tax=Nocardia goodfellowii TaxID=882446 RepID=A0ABS4Q9G0_9NOCA|nr:class I SAM-dependent methyltransferase [Nocardia goodfellowii]MBP2188328.1 ubiquinone/menaquinone biosynthesis C-methylase UbiE [Nocardia goodfellowii]